MNAQVLTDEPAVDDEVVRRSGDDPPRQRPIRMGEDNPVPVEVDDPDAPARAGDTCQLRTRHPGATPTSSRWASRVRS